LGISDARAYSALVIALLYCASSAYFLWIAPRRKARANFANGDGILIAYASQTGFAERLAQQTAHLLSGAGIAVRISDLAAIDTQTLAATSQALFIVSTTGEGDPPDPAAPFVSRVLPTQGDLSSLNFAVLALGDRAYANFCAFGRQVDAWLRHQGATPLFDIVEVDNGDVGALRHWQHQLGVVTNRPDLPDWQTPSYDRWRLTRRTLANPGSAGGPCFYIELEPLEPSSAHWEAGDILEIDPHNSTWTQPASPAPHREYSIASIPQDGAVHLLVRLMQRPDGTHGLGSGWLTQCEIGAEIAARIRPNRNFHAPQDDRPLLLIGNGTGIAGLRGLIKARVAAGRTRNWLVFGERTQAFDRLYAADIERWRRTGGLERVDLIFSRDQTEKRYVQHQLIECAAEVREWVEQGAAIYVCGSLEGMAPAVHAVLEQLLGAERLEELAAQGRYRRDVY
jgi:sulfite reductase (NADPH) flavoprotein alpha-component